MNDCDEYDGAPHDDEGDDDNDDDEDDDHDDR